MPKQSTRKPPAVTIFDWLEENVPGHQPGLTSTDARALEAAVQIIELYSTTCDKRLLQAFQIVVDTMQDKLKFMAYHAIAHVMDWGHREQLWALAALRPLQYCPKCKWEPASRHEA